MGPNTMNGVSPLKHGFVDLAGMLFVIGGVVSLIMNILTIPISSVYPFTAPTNFSMTFLVILGISLACSLGAIHCYSLATNRMLSEAGVRGIIFGALLLIFSLGIVGAYRDADTTTSLTAMSAVLILIAGIISFVLRHTAVSVSSAVMRVTQPARQT